MIMPIFVFSTYSNSINSTQAPKKRQSNIFHSVILKKQKKPALTIYYIRYPKCIFYFLQKKARWRLASNVYFPAIGLKTKRYFYDYFCWVIRLRLLPEKQKTPQ